MARLHGPHIPFKRPGDQLDDRKIANNWLEIERWCRRVEEQIQANMPVPGPGPANLPILIVSGYYAVPWGGDGPGWPLASSVRFFNGGENWMSWGVHSSGASGREAMIFPHSGRILINAHFAWDWSATNAAHLTEGQTFTHVDTLRASPPLFSVGHIDLKKATPSGYLGGRYQQNGSFVASVGSVGPSSPALFWPLAYQEFWTVPTSQFLSWTLEFILLDAPQ